MTPAMVQAIERAVRIHLPGRTVRAIKDRGVWIRRIIKVTLDGGEAVILKLNLDPAWADVDHEEKVAAQWRKEYNVPSFTVESVICDGCLDDGRKCSHCADCEIRACGVERGVVNCAHCPEYACERLEGFFGFVPDARAVLDEVRRGL